MSTYNSTPIWLVWNQNGSSPSYQHHSIDSATSEAERLARRNPGERFIVLESVAAYQINNLVRINMRPDVEAPF